MKKTLLFLAVICLATAVVAQVHLGYGKVVTATTNAVELTASGIPAKICHVTVTGSEIVYIQKNTAAADFVLTNAMPVVVDAPQTFGTGDDITSICYATSTNTSQVLISFE